MNFISPLGIYLIADVVFALLVAVIFINSLRKRVDRSVTVCILIAGFAWSAFRTIAIALNADIWLAICVFLVVALYALVVATIMSSKLKYESGEREREEAQQYELYQQNGWLIALPIDHIAFQLDGHEPYPGAYADFEVIRRQGNRSELSAYGQRYAKLYDVTECTVAYDLIWAELVDHDQEATQKINQLTGVTGIPELAAAH